MHAPPAAWMSGRCRHGSSPEFAGGRRHPVRHTTAVPPGRTRNLPDRRERQRAGVRIGARPRTGQGLASRAQTMPRHENGSIRHLLAVTVTHSKQFCGAWACAASSPGMPVAVSPTHEFSAVVLTVPTRPMQYVQAENIGARQFNVERPLALEPTLPLSLGFLRLWVVRLKREQARPSREPDSTVFLVGEDGGTLKRLSQGLSVSLHRTRRIRRNYPSILRETAVDQLRSEANFSDLGANVIRSHGEFDGTLGSQDAMQLQHAFAGHDHLLDGLGLS